jgi:tetratricopeptide (TPR) repeat protein
VGDDHDRAESDVRTALALKPNDATFHYWAGVLFRDRAEKLAAFTRCIELEPSNAQASVGHAWALALSGERADLEAAERSVRRVFETEPACLAAYWVGIDVSDRLGDYDVALWWFERARRYDPGFPRPDLSRSLALKYEREEQRKREEAELAAREAEQAERARLAAESGAEEASLEDEYMRQLRDWKPDDSLTRMNQEFWASRGSWGTNYHDYQGEAQVRALDRTLQRYGPR